MRLKVSSIVLLLIGCAAPNTHVPSVDIQLWAGNPLRASIQRAQTGQELACFDPSFNNYVCLSYEDLQKIYATFLRCKDWSNTQIESIQQAAKRNPDVIQKLNHPSAR